MCVSLAIGLLTAGISAATGIAGAIMTKKGADAQAQQVKYQTDVQNKQLKEEQDMIRIKASQQEAARLAEANAVRSRNMAYMAGSGVDENQSYLQGIDPWNQRELGSDIATLGLNARYQTNRIADSIAVNSAQAQFARTKADYETMGGIIRAVGGIGTDLAKGYNSRSYYAVGQT